MRHLFKKTQVWGNTRRRKGKHIKRHYCKELRSKNLFLTDIMASSKVIFFLHCTGLAQLFSYAIVGAYDFSKCKHSTIITEYQNLLKKNMEEDQSKRIINCCPLIKRSEPPDALLACIHNFTQRYIAPQQEEIWNFTVALLEGNCDGYSEQDNGTQNIEVTLLPSPKCNYQEQQRAQGNHALLELNEMWKHYLYLVYKKKVTLSS